MAESTEQFESRKRDHIEQAMAERNQATDSNGLHDLRLRHEALPDTNFFEISLQTESLSKKLDTPFLVSSMTAGHVDAVNLNLLLAKVCQQRSWVFAVGSQRRELTDSGAADEWKRIRQELPDLTILGNIGISQLIETSTEDIEKLVKNLGASGMIVHLNPLQESIQKEGTPNFEGSFESLKRLCNELSVPVVVKETGCGISETTLFRLNELKIAAVDVAGLGGTHWGRIEGSRLDSNHMLYTVAETFGNWGVSTLESLKNAKSVGMKCETWASGGMRTGLDAAKAIAMGSSLVGFAKPVLEGALKGEKSLNQVMETIEYELRTAIFCTGLKSVKELYDNDEVLVWPNH